LLWGGHLARPHYVNSIENTLIKKGMIT
jgi:hypothetical protein